MAAQNIINSIEFARKSLEIHDTILVSQFSRIADLLSSQDGVLEYTLSGRVNAQGKPELELNVTGVLNLICQRCLEPYTFNLNVASSFILVHSEADVPPEEENFEDDQDYLVADSNMPVLDLIEDEVLLALPFAPKHDSEHCNAKDDSGAVDQVSEPKKPNPFAVLKDFKAGKKQT